MNNKNENSPFNEEGKNFDLPHGYFQKSAASIAKAIEWQEEHRNFSKLLELKKINTKNNSGLNVPENYFITKESTIEVRLKAQLTLLEKRSAFEVPINYFEESKINELAKVLTYHKNELDEFHKLKALQKQNNFKVSETYFYKNRTQLVAALKTKDAAHVIPLFRRIIPLAAAALLVLSLGFWVYEFYFAPPTLKDCGTLACVDKQELLKIKNLENLDNDELYELVNPKQLEQKLRTKKNPATKENKDSSLKNVSMDDLLDEIE